MNTPKNLPVIDMSDYIAPETSKPQEPFKMLPIAGATRLRLSTKSKLVLGIGTNDATYRISYKEQGTTRTCPYYNKWRAMLKSHFSFLAKPRGNLFKGYEVTINFLEFMFFRTWYVRYEQAMNIIPYPTIEITLEEAQTMERTNRIISGVPNATDKGAEAIAYSTSGEPITPQEQEQLDSASTPDKPVTIEDIRYLNFVMGDIDIEDKHPTKSNAPDITEVEAAFLASEEGQAYNGDIETLRLQVSMGLLVLT